LSWRARGTLWAYECHVSPEGSSEWKNASDWGNNIALFALHLKQIRIVVTFM
jgi:hypothetical protein